MIRTKNHRSHFNNISKFDIKNRYLLASIIGYLYSQACQVMHSQTTSKDNVLAGSLCNTLNDMFDKLIW